MVFGILVTLLGAFIQFLVQAPVSRYFKGVTAKGKTKTNLKEKARRRLLNLPLLIGLADLIMWLVLPIFFATLFSGRW